MAMVPEIRPMTAGDKPAVMRILWATPEFTPGEVVVAEEVIDGYLGDPVGSGYYVLVAVVDRVVVGYMCYGPTPLTDGTWDLYWLAVAQEKRGLGIGGMLMRSVEARIREAHGRLALIETSSKPDYEKTRRFHRSQGYEEICRVPDFYALGDDKLILRKLMG